MKRFDRTTISRSLTLKMALFSILFSLMLLPSGCRKKGINGDLDGMWQVMEVIGPDGETIASPKRFYYAFQFHVCQLRVQNGIVEMAAANMVYADDMISLDFPYMDKILHPEELPYFGIFSNPVVFRVLELNRKTLVLESDDSRVTLRRF